jgi:hypothetical protein
VALHGVVRPWAMHDKLGVLCASGVARDCAAVGCARERGVLCAVGVARGCAAVGCAREREGGDRRQGAVRSFVTRGVTLPGSFTTILTGLKIYTMRQTHQ